LVHCFVISLYGARKFEKYAIEIIGKLILNAGYNLLV